MKTQTITSVKALELQAALNAAKCGRLKVGPEYYSVKAQGDIMLVDPVNGDPFVFIAPNTVLVFQHEPGSGTDHLRQRMLADIYFCSCTEK